MFHISDLTFLRNKHGFTYILSITSEMTDEIRIVNILTTFFIINYHSMMVDNKKRCHNMIIDNEFGIF